MLAINQALLVPGLRHPLLCSNQLRLDDVQVNDEPKHMVLNPTEYHHAIVIKTPDGNEQVEQKVIPLFMSGVFSYCLLPHIVDNINRLTKRFSSFLSNVVPRRASSASQERTSSRDSNTQHRYRSKMQNEF